MITVGRQQAAQSGGQRRLSARGGGRLLDNRPYVYEPIR